MDFAKRFKQIRLYKQLTQKELAELANVTQVAIHGWESGKRMPTLENARALCIALDISADTLLDLPPKGFEEIEQLGTEDDERDMLRTYRELDDLGKEAVEWMCRHELRRLSNGEDDAAKPVRLVPKYISPAAAGVAAPIDDAEVEMIRVDKGVPDDVDYAVVIQGDSMEPYIKDGDTVFVKRVDELQIGDIGIFSVDGSIVCKMFYKSGLGDIRLVSTNPRRADANINIMRDSSDTFACLGKVIIKKSKIKLPDYFMNTVLS